MSRLRESRDARIVLSLVGLALALRVAFVLAVDRDALPFNDMLFYHRAAQALADGQGYIDFYGQPTARWPPAFPYALSVLYRVFGDDPLAGELMNAILGALTVALLYVVALRCFGRRAAVVAGLLLALMPGQIFYAEGLLAESLYTFVLVAVFALLAYLPRTRWAAVVLGLAIGLAALTRGEGLMLLAVPVVAWWPLLPRRELVLRAAVLAAGAALVIVPWTVRNAVEKDAFIPISTNSSQTFYSGHNPNADGGPTYPSPELAARLRSLPPEELEVEGARLLRREALSYMRHHPLRELELIPKKLLRLNAGDSRAVLAARPRRVRGTDFSRGVVTAGIPPVVVRSRSTAELLGVVADIFYYGVLLLAALAFVAFRRILGDPVLRGVVAVFALSAFLYGFVFYGNFRYRAPLEPLMILLAAPVLVRLWDVRGGLPRDGGGT